MGKAAMVGLAIVAMAFVARAEVIYDVVSSFPVTRFKIVTSDDPDVYTWYIGPVVETVHVISAEEVKTYYKGRLTRTLTLYDDKVKIHHADGDIKWHVKKDVPRGRYGLWHLLSVTLRHWREYSSKNSVQGNTYSKYTLPYKVVVLPEEGCELRNTPALDGKFIEMRSRRPLQRLVQG